MTKRKRKRPALKRLRRQDVEFDFNGGKLTSDAGLLVLREVDQRLNLISRIDQAIFDPRDPSCTEHPQHEILTSRIFGIAAGYEDANDHLTLRLDPAFQVAAGRSPAQNEFDEKDNAPLASPSTHSRFENRIDSKSIFALHEIMVDTFLDSFDQPPEEIILDYDATDDTVHGNQQGRYFNGFYDSYCFLPLYVFCGDQILVSYLRPGSVGAAHHAPAVTRLLVNKIRSRWPNVKIILRGDSGYAIARLMRWCDKNDVFYVFGMQKNAVLEGKLRGEMEAARQQHEELGGKQTIFKWLRYRTQKSWQRHRWVCGKAEHCSKGANPRFVVTNLPSEDGAVDETWHRPRVGGKQVRQLKEAGTFVQPEVSAKDFYQEVYCQRGEMENRIKEQQLCLFADRTSCTKFLANQFRLMLSSFAYVLMDAVRRLGLSGTVGSRWRVDTIRLRLLKVAARVRVTCRRVVFHLSSHHPSERIFEDVMMRLSGAG
ncbi:MAG: IS1380 family transposase [Planctomycetota bacterium]